MKLYIKQRVFSWKEKFNVYNELGEPVYYVEGKFFSLSHEFTVYDRNGIPCATVYEKLFKLFAEYDIHTNNEHITLKKQLSFFKARYTLLGTSWILEGDIFDHNYSVISADHRPVMVLRKHWFTFGDSYELDIANPDDALKVLCIALSIDADLCNQGNN